MWRICSWRAFGYSSDYIDFIPPWEACGRSAATLAGDPTLACDVKWSEIQFLFELGADVCISQRGLTLRDPQFHVHSPNDGDWEDCIVYLLNQWSEYRGEAQ